jgi:long-chain fatty acid transport protein
MCIFSSKICTLHILVLPLHPKFKLNPKVKRMKKLLISTFVMCFSASVLAGGLNTNSNQNASFERQMSQNGIIDLAGLYANPAGTAFLANGWHLSYSHMSVWQQRNITTTFPLFAMNTANPGEKTHKFKGTAKAPVIPSISASYNHDKWSVNAHFAVTGGGGKCNFPNGLGSFESLVGGNVVNGIVSGIAQQAMGAGMSRDQATAYAVTTFRANPTQYFKGYSLDSQMEGHSYVFGGQFGATYKVIPNLSVFGGVRVVYGTNGYDGYIKDITYETIAGPGTAPDIELDCTQKGWGVTPIVGLDWKASDYLNLGVKFEAPTKMVYKNTSTLSPAAQLVDDLDKFRDGYKVREDLPAILSMGAMATPFEGLRLMTGWNVYFDSGVRKGVTAADGTELRFYKAGEFRPSKSVPELMERDIDANTWELNIGAEYDLNKYLTVSGSWQRTVYGISDTGISDLSFNNTNNMFAFGVRVKPTQHLSFDLGFMHTIYHDRSVTTSTAVGYKNDLYVRRNDVLGVGINYEF